MLSYRTVLVGIDFSELGEIAFSAAVSFAERMRSERLHLVHVLPSPAAWPYAEPSDALAIEDACERTFKLREQRLRERGGSRAAVTHETLTGNAVRRLVECAERIRADLIVLAGGRHSPIGRALLGSVANGVLRASHCPLLVVGEDRPGTQPIRRVIAAVDDSPIAERVIAHASALAAPENALIHVVSVHEARTLLDDAETMRRAWPRDLTTPELFDRLEALYRDHIAGRVERARVATAKIDLDIVGSGTPWRAILAKAKATLPDAIVIGTSGRNAWKRMFLGSTATRILSDAPCPVFAVPGEAEAR